jgi:hypothetical protein
MYITFLLIEIHNGCQGLWLHWFLDMVIVWQPLTSHGTYLSKTGNLVTLVPGYGDCLAAYPGTSVTRVPVFDKYVPWEVSGCQTITISRNQCNQIPCV